jgi:hypothetical protein
MSMTTAQQETLGERGGLWDLPSVPDGVLLTDAKHLRSDCQLAWSLVKERRWSRSAIEQLQRRAFDLASRAFDAGRTRDFIALFRLTAKLAESQLPKRLPRTVT